MRRSCALWLTPLGRAAGLLLLPLALSACAVSSLSNPFRSSESAPPPATGPDAPLPELPGDRTAAAPTATQAAALDDGSFHCPQVVAWPHDKILTVYAGGGASPQEVVHRGEITRLARECQIMGGRVTVKYGFAGRVMLGPKGRPGSVTMPYFVKVADAGRQVLANDGGSISTTITAENPVGYFSMVKEISFPVSVGTRPQDYKVFVALGTRRG